MTTMEEGNERLLKLADLLDTVDARHRVLGLPAYDQKHVHHECGAPACALGHWSDSQDGKEIDNEDAHFGIGYAEWAELFGFEGCGDAQSAKAAAMYIRGFVERRRSAVNGRGVE